MEKRFEEKMEQELEDNFAERESFGLRRREAGTEVESLVGEGEETFFEIQVFNVCIGLKQNQWKCSGDVSEMQTRHKSRHAHVVAVGSTKYDSEFQFSDLPLLLQQFCSLRDTKNALYFISFGCPFFTQQYSIFNIQYSVFNIQYSIFRIFKIFKD